MQTLSAGLEGHCAPVAKTTVAHLVLKEIIILFKLKYLGFRTHLAHIKSNLILGQLWIKTSP